MSVQHQLHIKNSWVKVVSLAVLFLYLLPYILFGENVHVWTHDNLDSVLIYNKILAGSGQIFSKNAEIIPNIMGGLPRSCYGSEFNFTLWLYYFFSPFVAYAFNLVFLHSIAFIGSVLLIKKHIYRGEHSVFIYPVALCFALMPFWSPGCLGIAGQPLLLYAFFNIRSKTHSYQDWLIIFLFPLFSSLIFSGLFFIIAIGLLFLYDTIKTKKINWLFFFSISLIAVIYLIVEYRVVLSFFLAPLFVSHRAEFVSTSEVLKLQDVFINAFGYFKTSQYHASSIHYPFMFIISILAIAYAIIKRDKSVYTVLVLLLISYLIMVYYQILSWEKAVGIVSEFKFLTEFKTERFYTLFPLLWLLILGLSTYLISKSHQAFLKYGVMILLVCQVCFSFFSSKTFNSTFRDVVLKNNNVPDNVPTFREFYSEDIFSEARKYINIPLSDFKVVSIGFDPAIPAYNGFYTLDMYVANYPLTYKHQFRKIIEKELDKNAKNKKKFDSWGSRCYTFAAEKDSAEINHLELDYNKLKQMDCRFLFSAKKINNSEKDLQFIYRVNGNRQLKYIYIYKLI